MTVQSFLPMQKFDQTNRYVELFTLFSIPARACAVQKESIFCRFCKISALLQRRTAPVHRPGTNGLPLKDEAANQAGTKTRQADSVSAPDARPAR